MLVVTVTENMFSLSGPRCGDENIVHGTLDTPQYWVYTQHPLMLAIKRSAEAAPVLSQPALGMKSWLILKGEIVYKPPYNIGCELVGA